MLGVLYKFTLSEQYPVMNWLDKLSLLTLDNVPLTDEQIINFYEDLEAVKQFGVEISDGAPTYYFFDSLSSTEVYALIMFTESQWNEVLNSQEMAKYEINKKLVYDALGWSDNGYKLVHSRDNIEAAFVLNPETGQEEINGRAGAALIWNSL